MKAKNFDKKFDEGKSMLADLDVAKARRINQEQKRVNGVNPGKPPNVTKMAVAHG